ncbi:ATP-dependent helicase HrpB [Falsirhodobacter halotolerans]|uniref:ATP-dependent helicase HrpB n=1 Tax=Falsirhodobacter halotolerans TaxID=1146892 RepID=UPI001FD09AA0|nr:ATP-dependent helicase HrpB [Falsirhodobacter halotolerans]MCJ8139904.1 ATP-dependent helicase HrpB [Falsirhodobacter halotolerans]
MRAPLPIDDAIPDLLDAISRRSMAVLQAPPGAGKTTRVPLALLDSGQSGRILMLEPRRLAARAAAERLAEELGEKVGRTVGYRIRGESKTGPATRIDVVTEGILTRILQDDPSLDGIGALIFDEFHERSLNADLGLAMALECRAALRDDLVLLVMSATLDAAPVAALMGDAPVVTSEGRSFPVETRWLPRPFEGRLEEATAALIRHALTDSAGDLLAFLPGEGEIRRVAGMLDGDVRPLFGAMPFEAQRAALAPSPQRRIILATSIAETSLTIPGIRVVVDAGRARRARFDPGSGMARLVTERVSRAEAEQRRGRAGRTAPGLCFRLWTKGEDGALPAFAPAEIEVADLTGLALELAVWGSDDLPFLTPPNTAAMTEARALLADLGALDRGRITDHGRKLARMPLHPRLGHMLALSGGPAPQLAALLAERDPLRGAPPDLAQRMAALRDPSRFAGAHRPTLQRIRDEAKRLSRMAGNGDHTLGQMAALAYPDRIGLRRKGEAPRWVLSGGKGAVMEAGQPLSGQRLIVATDLDGNPREAKVRQATPISDAELRGIFTPVWREVCEWSRREGRVVARRQEVLGALVLDDRHWDAPSDAVARAAFDGLRQIGLPWTAPAARLRARVRLCAAEGAEMPDVSDDALLADPDWLLPWLKARTEADLRAMDLTEPLRAHLGWDVMQVLDTRTPSHFTSPLGNRIPIDYDGEAPAIEVRLQEMFGLTAHPTVASRPLRVTLLSPARRPVQVTMDLPGFWANTYADVRKDMRGQYPRHPWPEDPTEAAPTLRAKPRGT